MKYRGYMYRFCAIHYIPPHLHDVFLGEKTISTPLFVGANPRKSRIFIPREETSHDVEQLFFMFKTSFWCVNESQSLVALRYWNLARKIHHFMDKFPTQTSLVRGFSNKPSLIFDDRRVNFYVFWTFKVPFSYLCLVGNFGNDPLAIAILIPATPSNPSIPYVKRTSKFWTNSPSIALISKLMPCAKTSSASARQIGMIRCPLTPNHLKSTMV